MIPHPLFRNIVVPLFMGLYFVKEYTDIEMDHFFKWFAKFTLCLVPAYIFLIMLGYNPITLILYPTWSYWLSPLQYLIYIPMANHTIYKNIKDHSYSFILSVISAAISGYLYEVPRWVLRGLPNLIRSSKYSVLILDFGMLAIPFLFFMVRDKKIVLSKSLILSALIYLFYVGFYTQLTGFYLSEVYHFIKVPLTVMCRIPAMIFIYCFVSEIKT
jgi:hypothetical protein